MHVHVQRRYSAKSAQTKFSILNSDNLLEAPQAIDCPEEQLYVGARVVHSSRGKGIVTDINSADPRQRPFEVTFAKMHRYGTSSVQQKIRMVPKDKSSQQFCPVQIPIEEMRMGTQVLEKSRGLGSVIRNKHGSTVIKFRSGLQCTLSDSEVMSKIYIKASTKVAQRTESSEDCSSLVARVLRQILKFLRPSRGISNIINNVSGEVDPQELWLSKWAVLFEDYHSERFAYLAGAVLTLNAFIVGTSMAAAQQHPHICKIEGWVLTVSAWLTALYLFYSKPFIENLQNIFCTADFTLQAVALTFLLVHQQGVSTPTVAQIQILVTMGVMLAFQLYNNLVDMMSSAIEFVVETVIGNLQSLIGLIRKVSTTGICLKVPWPKRLLDFLERIESLLQGDGEIWEEWSGRAHSCLEKILFSAPALLPRLI
jgi:hypothetical protein